MPTIIIDVDSLRPDHIGAYGYEAPTTPTIDSINDDAIRFETAYVANSPCMPSRAALLSGRYGVDNGVVSHGPSSQRLRTPAHEIPWAGTWSDHTEERPWWTLPQLCYKNRLPTYAVSSFPRHPAPWFQTTWHQLRQPQEPSGLGESFQTVRAEHVVDEAIDVLDSRDGDEFVLYIQLWDPHSPYNRPQDEVDRFRDGPLPTHPTAEAIDTHREWNAWKSATQLGIDSRADLGALLANYDAEIRYADEHLGRLIDHLRHLGLYEESLLVLTADHGEEFGEHGLYQEHWSTHDGTQRVPLLVKPPADTPADIGARENLVTNVDLAPTIAAYNELEAPAKWQGRSLRPLVEDASAPWRDHVVLEHGLYTAQRAIRTDQWKLIRTFHPGMWSGMVPSVQLFDMAADPAEQVNLAPTHPKLAEDLLERMAGWVDEYRGGTDDPLRDVTENGPAGYRAFGEDFDGV